MNKTHIDGLEERVVKAEFTGSLVVHDGITYKLHNPPTKAYKRYVCSKTGGCNAYIALVHSAKKGPVLAILLNQDHKGHKVVDSKLYNMETGRSRALESFMNHCDILQGALLDLNQAFETGITERWIKVQDENVKASAVEFNRHVALNKKFEKKFDSLEGSHRAYGHLQFEANEQMHCTTLIEYLRYLGQSGTDSEERTWGEKRSFNRLIALRNAWGIYEFSSLQLTSGVSEELAKSVEALTIGTFDLSSGLQKQIINKLYPKCDPKYLFDDDKSNLELGSFLLVRGASTGNFAKIDLSPKKTSGNRAVDDEQLKLYEKYRLAHEDSLKLKYANRRINKLEELFDEYDIEYADLLEIDLADFELDNSEAIEHEENDSDSSSNELGPSVSKL